ncbi:MAG TPA: zf-HC2 domain-containing protein [Candidatus Limnocylindrales bacterium]|nr:zf-HC2 domain-containing protein [Candidatus Limnocylindrales bacterium]
MIDHRHAIELAATAIDFVLDDRDRGQLEEHLHSCESCRFESSAMRRDASSLASLPDLEPPTWVRRAIGRPHGPRRAVLLIAAALVLAATVGVAFAVGATLRDHSELNPQPSSVPRATVTSGTPRPSVETSPSASPSIGPPPVGKPSSFPAGAGSARFAAGPDGGVWVLADHPGDLGPDAASTSVLGLLDRDGRPRPGWPIAFDGWSCDADAPPHGLPVAADGSIRLVCASDTTSEGPQRHVALAFGADGQALPGWPVELPLADLNLPPVVVGNELRVLAREVASTDGTGSAQPAAWWLIGVSANGDVRVGQRFEVADAAGNFDVRLAADGVAYRVAIVDQPTSDVPVVSVIDAIDLDGARPGWPVTVEGSASHPVVGPNGRLVITRRIGTGDGARAQTMTIDPGGGDATATSDGLPIDPLDDRTGAGARVIPPVVASDGTVFVIGSDKTGQRAFVVDPPLAGRGVPPARLKMPLQPMGSCNGVDIGCGVWRTLPVVGPDGTLYVPESAVGEGGGLSASSGGSLVATAPDGRVRDGWPVFLPDPMAGYWSVIVRSDGTVDALAVYPTDGGAEWTLLILGPDGTTRASTPIIRP